MLLGLAIVRIEAAELHVEDLPIHTEAGSAGDDARDGLQRDAPAGLSVSMLVTGSRYCGGFGMPPTPAGAMAVASSGLRLHRAVDNDFVFLGKEIGLIGRQDRLQRVRSPQHSE